MMRNNAASISSSLLDWARAPWPFARIFGHVVIALWIWGAIALVDNLIQSYDPDYMARYSPKYFWGFVTTLKLVVISVSIGAVLSIPVAFGRMSRNRIFAGFSYCYVYFFRGTPLLAQIFLVYYGFGQFRPELQDMGLWWLFRDAWYCALLTFSLNTAAYQAEILRGAVQSVPRGQPEAAQALGLHKAVIFFRIVLPQALIVALRPYGNEIILMVKGSAIVSIVTVFDLMGETKRAFSQTYDFQMYIYAALFYLVVVELMRRLWDVFEDRLTHHLKRIPDPE